MRPHPSAESNGFVLISVVIFVLIITLIGLSIFSLGGYETSFFGQDVNHSASYLAAKGGMVRARFILESVDRINDNKRVAQTSLAPGVARVVVWQDQDSTGSVSFYDTQEKAALHAVEIDVTGQVGNSQRTLSARFIPVEAGAQSRNLLSIAGSLSVGSDGDVSLDGPVRQSSNDLSWLPLVTGLGIPPDVQVTNVQVPDVNAYIQAHKSVAQGGPVWNGGAWHFDGGFYDSPDGAAGSGWAFDDHTGGTSTIAVRGYNVWLVESGFHFRSPVVIENAGSASDPGRLVIVSDRGGPIPGDYGGRLDRGISSSGVPVAIVSNGRVVVGKDLTVLGRTDAYNVSIFSAGVELHHTGLYYDAAVMDSVLLNLQLNGLYPNTTPGSNGVLTPVATGWVDMSYPLNN